jgi:hypothetical protein
MIIKIHILINKRDARANQQTIAFKSRLLYGNKIERNNIIIEYSISILQRTVIEDYMISID